MKSQKYFISVIDGANTLENTANVLPKLYQVYFWNNVMIYCAHCIAYYQNGEVPHRGAGERALALRMLCNEFASEAMVIAKVIRFACRITSFPEKYDASYVK